ncbi:MAG: hypothetical protein ACI30S_09980 [Muribaculaceae bacterium]
MGNIEEGIENRDNAGGVVRGNGLGVREGEKVLVGVHNISEEKLDKAIRQGGLANPSVAVIDTSRQKHEGYGDVSLIMPSEKIERKSGNNAGTWQGDAWTPTYPQVERKMSTKGVSKSAKDVMTVPKEMQGAVSSGLREWLDGNGESGMAYLFLHERGEAPETRRVVSKYGDVVYEELKGLTSGNFSIYGLSEADLKGVLSVYIDVKYGGDEESYRKSLEDWVSRNRSRADDGKGLIGKSAKENMELYEKYGFDYKGLERFVREVRYDYVSASGVDTSKTFKSAEEYIDGNNLRGEFEDWLEGKSKEYGVKEVIFDGYTASGNRRYVDNTLENVSRIMKREGRNGVVGLQGSFSRFAARLMPSYGNLEDIRSRKGLLTGSHKEIDEFREKWTKVYLELGMKCQPKSESAFDMYGLERLSQAATKKNPGEYLRREYGVELSGADVKKLEAMVRAIKEDYPAMYFETKYERPVMFGEFSGAVVPRTMKESAKDFLRSQGVALYEYDKDVEGDRSRAFSEAIRGDGIRFQRAGNVEERDGKGLMSLKGEEAEKELQRVLSMKEATEMPDAIESLEKFKEIFSKPVRTVLGKDIIVKDSVFKKIISNNRSNLSGTIMATLEDADFVIRDTDGSLLYVKRYLSKGNENVYNIAVVNKSGEFEDYISSVHIKRDGNLLNKIKNGAELLLPDKRDGDGTKPRNNSTPGAKVGNNSENSKKNADGVVSEEGIENRDNADGVVRGYGLEVSEGGARVQKALEMVRERYGIKPVSMGSFGPVFDVYKGDAKNAIALLRLIESGEVVGALHHDEIGDIDLVWGKTGTGRSDGYGLAKLIKYHPEVLEDLQGILDSMEVTARSDNRIQLESDTHQASVRLTWDNESKKWLLTAFEKKKNSVSDNTTDTAGTERVGKQNDTATLQNTVSGGKDSEKVSDVQEGDNAKGVVKEGSEEAKVARVMELGDSLGKRVRIVRGKSVGSGGKEAINDRFNEDLQKQIDGELPKGYIYKLGTPGEILVSCGFPNKPIEMSSTNLQKHASIERHPFELSDISGLVNALQSPVAVFEYGDRLKSQNVIVEISKNGKNFLVGIHFNQTRDGIEVSSIRGIFPKNSSEWLNWISQGKALYLDKEKIQTLIDQQRKNLADVEYLDLDDVAKVVNNFENPKSAVRKNGGDVLAERKGKSKGWYDVKTGEVVVVIDNNVNVSDVENTVLHEVVGHDGLRELVGEERFGEFLDEVYEHLTDGVRAKVDAAGGGVAVDREARREAVEEYMADMAGRIGEKGFEAMEAEELTLWGRIKAAFEKLLDKFLAGIKWGSGVRLSDKSIAYILYRSWKNKRGDMISRAEGEVMRRKSGYDSGDEVRFRDGGMGLEEEVTRRKVEAARANEDDMRKKVEAVRAIGGDLSRLRRAMARQREYDVETVKQVTDLANVLIEHGYFSDLQRGEVKALLSAAKNAVGKTDTSKYVERVLDLMIDNRMRSGKTMLERLLHTKGSRVNERGVEVMGRIDADGQKVLMAVKEAIGRFAVSS